MQQLLFSRATIDYIALTEKMCAYLVDTLITSDQQKGRVLNCLHSVIDATRVIPLTNWIGCILHMYIFKMSIQCAQIFVMDRERGIGEWDGE